MNRYFINNPPTTVLDPSYCHPGSNAKTTNTKLVALVKKHEDYRNE
jgi:hypothetical protein